jgi:hypothetical protein
MLEHRARIFRLMDINRVYSFESKLFKVSKIHRVLLENQLLIQGKEARFKLLLKVWIRTVSKNESQTPLQITSHLRDLTTG